MGILVIAAKSAAVWLYLILPLDILIGWRLLGEQPTISLIFSGAIILIGVIVANSGKKETAGQAPSPDKKLAKGKQAAQIVTPAE